MLFGYDNSGVFYSAVIRPIVFSYVLYRIQTGRGGKRISIY